jgi:hypothetical protein
VKKIRKIAKYQVFGLKIRDNVINKLSELKENKFLKS